MIKYILSLLLLAGPMNYAQAATEGGGGGNALNGRPIETYAGDLKVYPGYKKVVVPLLEKLDAELPSLAVVFRDVIEKKVWYFVPTKLNLLSSNLTGVQFPSDQVIVQKKNSVWVNSIEFREMTHADQGTLIIHELVLGAMMLKKNYLDSNDHDAVRESTIYLLRKTYTGEELRELLFMKEVGSFVIGITELEQPSSTIGDFYNFLQSAKDNKTLPNLYNYQNNLFSKVLEVNCRNEFEFTGGMTLKARMSYLTVYMPIDIVNGESRASKVEETAVPVEASFENISKVQVSSDHISYWAVEGDEQARNGELRRALILTKSSYGFKVGDELSSLHLAWAVCAKSAAGLCRWDMPTRAQLDKVGLRSPTIRLCAGRSYYDGVEIE